MLSFCCREAAPDIGRDAHTFSGFLSPLFSILQPFSFPFSTYSMPSPYLSHKAARRPRRLDTRKGFVFYFSWLDNLSYLSSDERNAVVLAIVDYARTLQPPTHLSGQAMVAFAFCRDIILHEAERFAGLDDEAPTTATTGAKSARNAPSTPENQSPTKNSQQIDIRGVISPENQPFATVPRTRDSNNNSDSNKDIDKNTSSSSSDRTKEKGEGGLRISESRDADAVIVPAPDAVSSASAVSSSVVYAPAASSATPSAAHPTPAEVEALWQARGYRSSAQEFYDYNEQRNWFTKDGTRICRWKTAAQNWERRYCEVIAPLRERAAAQQALEHQRRINCEAAVAYRREQQEERERESRRSRLLAVSHEEAQVRFAEALAACDGDAERAIALLKARDMARLAELEGRAGGAALP